MLRTRSLIRALSVTLLLNCFVATPSSLAASGFEIRLNSYEREAIYEIFSSMGEKNLAKLLLDSRRLTKLGDSIQHVPPLQLLGYIITTPYLKDCMGTIYNSYFKWSAFLDGFSTNMDHELDSGRLLPQIESFATITHGNAALLQSLARNRDWEQFVKVLL